MKILVIGSGGREHALAWKLKGDSRRPEIFCAPGNAGTATLGTNLAIKSEDLPSLLAWAKQHKPDLTVVGPEAPLCAGITDLFQAAGLRVFGPCQAGARLEGSKQFSKEMMAAAGVPTAKAATFTDVASAKAYLRREGAPIVVKADGLAAGKGVTVAMTLAEAEAAVDEALVTRAFGDAGNTVLIEEFLDGEEASILALLDGEHVVLLASSQDHKRVGDGDTGPNTGGMGAYSPAPVVTAAHTLPQPKNTSRNVPKNSPTNHAGVFFTGSTLSFFRNARRRAASFSGGHQWSRGSRAVSAPMTPDNRDRRR